MIQWNEREFVSLLYRAFFDREPDGCAQQYLYLLENSSDKAATAASIIRQFVWSEEHTAHVVAASKRRVPAAKDIAIVFVANDRVYDQTLAFLESLYRNSPGIPLICIPYAKDLTLTQELAEIYDFQFHDNFDMRGVQNIAKIVYGKENPRLRKIGAFTIDAAEFLSLDVDIIVLKDLLPYFGYIGDNCDILFTDVGNGGTYKDKSHPLLKATYEINTGAYVSSKNVYDRDLFVSTIINNFELFQAVSFFPNDDQPFMSFVFDLNQKIYKNPESLGIPYSSRIWYKHSEFVRRGDDVFDTLVGKPVSMIHFAGVANEMSNADVHVDLYNKYLAYGQSRVQSYRCK